MCAIYVVVVVVVVVVMVVTGGGASLPHSQVSRFVILKRPSEYSVVERGVVGRAGGMRAIAPSMLPHACPQQGSRKFRA